MSADHDYRKPSIALVGAGVAGTSVLLALRRKGYTVTGIASRSQASARRCADLLDCGAAVAEPAAIIADAQLVIIATPDSMIQTVCGSAIYVY